MLFNTLVSKTLCVQTTGAGLCVVSVYLAPKLLSKLRPDQELNRINNSMCMNYHH